MKRRRKTVVLRGWMAKPKGKPIPTDDIPQVYHLRSDANFWRDPAHQVVRVEIHELS